MQSHSVCSSLARTPSIAIGRLVVCPLEVSTGRGPEPRQGDIVGADDAKGVTAALAGIYESGKLIRPVDSCSAADVVELGDDARINRRRLLVVSCVEQQVERIRTDTDERVLVGRSPYADLASRQ